VSALLRGKESKNRGPKEKGGQKTAREGYGLKEKKINQLGKERKSLGGGQENILGDKQQTRQEKCSPKRDRQLNVKKK